MAKDIDDLLMGFEVEVSDASSFSGKTLLPDKPNAEVVNPPYNTDTNLEAIPRVFGVNEMVSDFIQIRNDLLQVIEGTKDLLRSIPVETCVAKPSMVAAIASLHGSINANGRLLLEIHEKIIKMQREYILMEGGVNPDQPNVNNITTNNLTVNTKDLNGMIEDLLKKMKTE